MDLVLEQTASSSESAEAAPLSTVVEPVPPILSKRGRKKLQKMERWAAERPVYLEKKRLKKQMKKRQQKENKEASVTTLDPSKQEGDKIENQEGISTLRKRVKAAHVGAPSKLRIAIDMSFDNLMLEGEVTSVTQQVQNCHGFNKKLAIPCNIFLTSLSGRAKERFTGPLASSQRWKNFVQTEQTYLELFPKEDLVYLTADSPNVLMELDDSKVYIIGGIVDRNRHKGLCFNKAVEQGIGHAQLPIAEFLKMSSRKVLAVNHVFEIMMSFWESKNWATAMAEVMPARKQFSIKLATDDSDQTNEDNLTGLCDALSSTANE